MRVGRTGSAEQAAESTPRHRSGKPLFDIADVVIDTRMPALPLDVMMYPAIS
jgi:uncharacterized phosphosugar-binding protein